jgi:hypothetical protein
VPTRLGVCLLLAAVVEAADIAERRADAAAQPH